MRACRCCRSCAASGRRRGRSSSTRWRWWRRPCSHGAGAAPARSTWCARSRSGPSSSGWRSGCGARRRRAGRCFSSTTRCSTSRSSSRRSRSTRWSADGSGARAPQRPSRLAAVRRLHPALRRHGRDRPALSPLPVVDGIWLARPDEVGAGEPVAVKDLLDTAGLVTTYGSALFAEHVPVESAEAVRLLEAEGFAVAGKTNLHEFAYGISSQNAHYGTVPNPVAPGRLAGGSSGGSAAAVAAGEVRLALGTDSGGSIRIPASWCGIVGFKPTYGLVPADGCFPLAPSYDHVGPIAATVDGCIELMQALAPGFEPETLDSFDDLEVGYAWLDHADPLVRARVEDALAHFPHKRALDVPAESR